MACFNSNDGLTFERYIFNNTTLIMNLPLLKVKNRLWIEGRHGAFLGQGRITLLQSIEEHGSISKAASAMNLSYLKAWKLVNSMNKASKKPLVIRVSGGKGGGGSTMTEYGRHSISLYQELNKRCNAFLQKELEKLMKEKDL